jgi:hypothetical protein
MNRTAGWIAGLAVVIAAARIAQTPTTPPAPASSAQGADHDLPGKPSRSSLDFQGGCEAFTPQPKGSRESHATYHNYGSALAVISNFLEGSESGTSRNNKTPRIVDPITFLKSVPSVSYTLVLAPDPVHTQLSVMFDREMGVIQQAAQDEGYIYNSSWLPWSAESQTYESLQDTELARRLRDGRANCPGLLLFRAGVQQTKDPYLNGSIVLVVGEQPTGGVNQAQWDNAIAFLTKITRPHTQTPLRVLGPTFSGSAASLSRDMKSLQPHTFGAVQVLSGSLSDCEAARRITTELAAAPVAARFGTFQESDEVHILRFMKLLASQKVDAQSTAILSEDETAYGAAASNKSTEDPNATQPCRNAYNVSNQPLRLFYPRDMSAVRLEYQKQGLFNPPEVTSYRPRLVLNGAAETSNGSTSSDTIRNYGGAITALTEEASLYAAVSELRAHHTRYLLLRCTNPLDYLFLTRFLHRTYPEGRVVIVGQDLLLQREVDTTEFRGVLSLSTYPLLPRDQHWTELLDGRRRDSHPVFESNLMQGIYIAARYTFGAEQASSPVGQLMILPRKPNLVGYTNPFWLHDPDSKHGLPPTFPPSWVSVLGRDGFWPLAVLGPTTIPKLIIPNGAPYLPNVPDSMMVQLSNSGGLHYDLGRQRDPKQDITFSDRLLFRLPFAWELATLLAVALFLYHAYGAARYGSAPSGGLFSVFYAEPSALQNVLFTLSAGIVCASLLSIGAVRIVLPSLRMLHQTLWILSISLVAPLISIVVFAILIAKRSSIAFSLFVGITILFAAVGVMFRLGLEDNEAIGLPLFYRMCHLSSGVSPLLPLLLFITGAYLGCWQALAGNLLFGRSAPQLPILPRRYAQLSRRRDEAIRRIAQPLRFNRATTVPALLVGLSAVILCWKNYPILSLEGYLYTRFINILVLIALMLVVSDGARLFWTWTELRRLLDALNRLPLRRTFVHLEAVPATSLWSVAGDVQRIQGQFFSAQLDAARRLALLCKQSRRWRTSPACLRVEMAYKYGVEFAKQNATRNLLWTQSIAPRHKPPKQIRRVMAVTARDLVVTILDPIWKHELESLNLTVNSDPSTETERHLSISKDKVIAAAEEFVCIHYVSYIQNVLARMRTMVLSIIFLFVSVCLTVSFYPFIPRTQVTLWMILEFAFIATVVVYVYGGMERDKTLSYLTNTQPGRLSVEFWIKTLGFLAGPIFGILATQFPVIADSILGFLQPGLNAK